ncbi:MAG: TonB-dependent receptor, partial [Oxalobacteraceae bacterium]
LKGAQGTLYGGGSLGGVLRIEPERPNLTRASGFVDATISSTRSGGLSSALAGVINLPIVGDAIGSRFLAYRTRDAGYIDDVGRNLKNVNRTTTVGGRAQLRAKAGPWQIDIIGTHQRVQSRDSDYASGDFGALSRTTGTAQPSSNSFDLIDVEARRKVAGNDLVSSTSIGRNNLSATYDATTRVGSPASFEDARRLKTLNHETRLSHSDANGAGWILGVAGFAEREASEQITDQPALTGLASNLRSERLIVALFGQGSHRSGDLLITAGLRGTYSRQKATTELRLVENGFADGAKVELNVSPMVEVTWVVTKGTSASVGFRQGFRSGGNSIFRVDQGFANVLTAGFYGSYYHQDIIRVASLELNQRIGGVSPFDLHATLSAARWNRTQGSVVDDYGFFFPVNTNGSTLFNADLSASWLIQPGLSVRASGSFTLRSALGPGTAVEEVPSVPKAAVTGSFAWEKPLIEDLTLGIEGRVSYRGKSRLGFGFLNNVVQGDVLFTSVGARLKRDACSLSISVENLFDDRASRFGYGNPFTVQTEQQNTPQRPRTLSVGLNAEF